MGNSHAPTYNIATLQKGTAIATWQITGVSAGVDSYVIGAAAKNSHQSFSFQDTYLPAPAITIFSSRLDTCPNFNSHYYSNTQSNVNHYSYPNHNPGFFRNIHTIPIPNTFSNSNFNLHIINTTNPNINTKHEQPIIEQLKSAKCLRIWFTTPTEGATLTAGHKTIEWIATGGSGSSIIRLELSKVGSSGPWTTLVENLTSRNNFIWAVPNQQADCIIRATAVDSITPTQEASVTVATKIVPIIQPETSAIISVTLIVLLFAILAMLILKRRIKQKVTQGSKKMLH
jgi:hypothetical protein